MESEFLNLINEQLNLHKKIKFDACFVTKGCLVEIEIGAKKNEQCGEIFDFLQEWLGYGEFLDYVINHGGYGEFNGEFVLEDNEIIIYLTINGTDLYDEPEEKSIYFEEEFITEKLKINLASIGMDEGFEIENLSLDFYKDHDKPIVGLKFWYYGQTIPPSNSETEHSWNQIQLNEEQTQILISFLEQEVSANIPDFDIDFECDIQWSVHCEEKKLEYIVNSSPIRIALKEVIESEDK
jgi:hypothetical protein